MARRGPDQPTKLSAGDVRRNVSTISSIPDKPLHLPTKCSGDGRRGPRFQLNRREWSSSRPACPLTCAGPTRRTHPALCSCTTCRSRSFPRNERCIRRFAMRDKRPKCAQSCGERCSSPSPKVVQGGAVPFHCAGETRRLNFERRRTEGHKIRGCRRDQGAGRWTFLNICRQ
jgi:hypothetical protein